MLQARRGLTGIMNYTNPGAISHNEILELYKSYIDSDFSWKNFSLEEQAKVIIAPRSNNLLDTARVRFSAESAFTGHKDLHARLPGSPHDKAAGNPGYVLKYAALHLIGSYEVACVRVHVPLQIEGEFPEILGIRESLIKHVFEPAALQVNPTSLSCTATLPPSCHHDSMPQEMPCGAIANINPYSWYNF